MATSAARAVCVVRGWAASGAARRSLTTTSRPLKADGYPSKNGLLFNETVSGAGRVREPWERIYFWGMLIGCGGAAIGAYLKPETSSTAWARKEAQQRLETSN
eukprot:m.481160 g.481160  ORF g.481160 m.481160 type:complete len:103 (+) comp22060_c0_seq1:40-348(+)